MDSPSGPESSSSSDDLRSTSSTRAGDSSPRTASSSRRPTTANLPTILRSFENGHFFRLWLGTVFLMGATQMQMLVRGYLTYELTESATLVGIVSSAGAVAVLVFALWGGAIADRVERRRVIQLGQGVSVVLALIVGVAVLFDVIAWYHLLMAGIVQGIMWSFLAPARQALVPQLVGTQNLGNAIALTAAAMSGSAAVAPSIAGVLYGRIGPEGVYFVIAGMSAVAVLLTTSIPRTPLEREGKKPPMLEDIKDGIQYLLRSPFIMTLLLFGLGMTMIVMPYRFLLPVYVVEVYGRGSESLGLLLSIVGVGSLAGSLFIASITRWHRGLLLLGGGFAAGLALITTSAIPIFFVAAPFMLMLGLGDSSNRSLNQTLVMENMDAEYRGRIMSLWMMKFGLMPLGILPISIIAEQFGPQASFTCMGVAIIIITLLILLSNRQLRTTQ
ncbi:MAG: MFS transporter [Chloroflexota bacterium]|nr:MFS transporter [Chloroflexota bacterium]